MVVSRNRLAADALGFYLRGPLRFQRGIIACALMATLATVGLTAVAPPQEAAAAPASISRPEPPIVSMICASGQFDINTSDAASIATTLGVEPRRCPTVGQSWSLAAPR